MYRIAQEALTNVVRHAQAQTVEVTLYQENNNIVMCMQDNGRGFDQHQLQATAVSERRHLGLISMRRAPRLPGAASS